MKKRWVVRVIWQSKCYVHLCVCTPVSCDEIHWKVPTFLCNKLDSTSGLGATALKGLGISICPRGCKINHSPINWIGKKTKHVLLHKIHTFFRLLSHFFLWNTWLFYLFSSKTVTRMKQSEVRRKKRLRQRHIQLVIRSQKQTLSFILSGHKQKRLSS